MVKSIFKRIVVAVSVALILMLLKGSLISNVYASEIYSIETANGGNFASCSNGCNSLSATGQGSGLANYIKNKTGNLFLNVMVYSESDSNSFIPTLTKVRISAHNETYNCFISGSGNGYLVSSNLLNRYVNSYSAICPVEFDSVGGIQEIYIQTNGSGTGGISLYSPMTFVVDSNQEVINSITENSQNEIQSQKVCKKYDKSTNPNEKKSLNNQGVLVDNDNFNTSNFIKVNSSDTTIKVLSRATSGAYHCFYDINKTVISCAQNGSLVEGENITIPTNASYFRFPSNRNTSIPTLEICRNGNQGIVDSNEQLNDTLNDNNISDSTNSSINSVLGSKTQQETFGPVADLILLPLTLFRAFYNGFNGSCSSFDLGTLFNTHLVLPCINLRSIFGNSLYSIIDVAISLFMIYNIVLMCIHIFDKITSFKDPFEDLFKPGGGF